MISRKDFAGRPAALAAYEAVTRLIHPHHVSDLIAIAVAALAGFAGKELAARYRIRDGPQDRPSKRGQRDHNRALRAQSFSGGTCRLRLVPGGSVVIVMAVCSARSAAHHLEHRDTAAADEPVAHGRGEQQEDDVEHGGVVPLDGSL